MSEYTTNERRILVLAGAGHFVAHFAELMYPTLAVSLAADTGIPLAEVLGWSTIGYLLFGLGALPAGYLADRIGSRWIVLTSLAGTGAATIAAGLSTPGPMLAAALAALGLAASLYHPAGMSLISRGVRARGRALGLNGIAGNAGIALTPVCTAVLIGLAGWRGAYIACGTAILLVTALLAARPISEPRGDQPDAAATAPDPYHLPRFALLCLAAMLAGISYRANTVAQPAFFAERVTLVGYGTATTLAYLAGMVGQYVGGRLADRYPLRYLYLATHLASIPALLIMARLTELPLLLTAGTFVFFSLGMQPIENSLFAQLTPPRLRGTGYGMKFVVTFGVGALGVQLVRAAEASGDLSRTFPWVAIVVALAALTVGVFIAVPTLFAPRRRR